MYKLKGTVDEVLLELIQAIGEIKDEETENRGLIWANNMLQEFFERV